jgi:ribosomal protein S18 acetylase RimI-like enzyme
MSPAAAAPRRAGSRDVHAVAGLLAELLAHHAALDGAFAVRAVARDRLPGLVARMLRDPDTAVFVCEGPEGLAGFCSVRLERAPEALAEAARAEIGELGVASGWRRRGVGRALALAACAWARSRGAERVLARVAARNAEGQAFWRALGYGDFLDVLERRL